MCPTVNHFCNLKRLCSPLWWSINCSILSSPMVCHGLRLVKPFHCCMHPYPILFLSMKATLTIEPKLTVLFVMVQPSAPIAKIGIRSYWKETHYGWGPPMFTILPLHNGWVISILIRTRIHLPLQSPVVETLMSLTIPSVFLIASAFCFRIHLHCYPWIWT